MTSNDDLLKICKLWTARYGYRLPAENDTIEYNEKLYNIGNFIKKLKHGYYKNIKSKIEEIFNCRIISNQRYTDKMCIEICKKWILMYGQVLPKSHETIEYRNKTVFIGKLIANLRHGQRKSIKKDVEELFNQEINAKYEIIKLSKNDWIKACKKWIEEHGQILPKSDNKVFYNNHKVNVGRFIVAIKKGYHQDIKDEIEKLFNTKIEFYPNVIEVDDETEEEIV